MVEMLPCFYLQFAVDTHSSVWSQCEQNVWHWFRTADELIGFSTLAKRLVDLISNFLKRVPPT